MKIIILVALSILYISCNKGNLGTEPSINEPLTGTWTAIAKPWRIIAGGADTAMIKLHLIQKDSLITGKMQDGPFNNGVFGIQQTYKVTGKFNDPNLSLDIWSVSENAS
jgi:hypothetical protein